MFNLESLTEITGTAAKNLDISVLDAEQAAILLVAESVQDLCRPISRLSSNTRIAIQQQFNRQIALSIKKADSSTAECLQELAMQAAMRVQSAQQSGEDEATQEATERLERVINFFQDLAANVSRNSFYRHEEAERMETPAADATDQGIDGAVGAFETRSKYAGWKNVGVEATVLKEAAENAVDGLLSVIKALLPMASSYLQGFMTNDKGEVLAQLGYRRLPESAENEVEYERFYTVRDVWKDIAANRRETVEPMSAEAAASAFKL